MKNLLKKFSVIIVIFCITGSLFAKSYEPDFVVSEYINSLDGIDISVDGKNYIVSSKNSNNDVALIFYPGGYVECEAYLPLLVEFAKKDIKCIMPKMFHNLAIYNISAANKIMKDSKYSEIKTWYVGGHSLGGAMAAVYAGRKSEKLEGLILMAAYSTKNLSKTDLNIISIYGSNDGVLGMKKYEKYRKNLPATTYEQVLEGGNHSNFGSYGFQKKDHPATLSPKEQKEITAEFVKEKM